MKPVACFSLAFALFVVLGFSPPAHAQGYNQWFSELGPYQDTLGPTKVPAIGTSHVLVIYATGPSGSTRILPEWGRLPTVTRPSIWDTTSTDTMPPGILNIRKYYLDASFNQHDVRIDTVMAVSDTLSLLVACDPPSKTFDTLVYRQVDSLVDIRRYDYDGDHWVDMVFLYIVGYPINAGWFGVTEPYQSRYHLGYWIGGGNGFIAYISPGYPQWAGLMLTCHEYGHGFGWPDLYGSQSCTSPPYNLGDGAFCIMSLGYCARTGYPLRPMLPCPPLRVTGDGLNQLWVQPTLVREPLYRVHLSDFNSGGPLYKLYPDTTGALNFGYWFVANYDRTKYWTRSMPGKGLVVMHEGESSGLGNIDVEAAHGRYDWNQTNPCQPVNLGTPNDSTGKDTLDIAAPGYSYPDTQEMSVSCFFDPTTKTIFDGLSNPSTRAKYRGHYYQTHCAIYNIARDPADSTVIVADLLANNWFGHVSRDTFWGPGHYVITGDVTVDPGVTLTIKPGTTIDFYPHVNNQSPPPPPIIPAGIYVQGYLKAVGDSAHPIVFRSNASLLGQSPSNNDWQGIFLKPGSKDTLKYCQISDCYTGIHADNVSALVCSCNTIQNTQAYGIKLTNVPSGIKVMRNRILNPSPTYGVYLERTNTTTPTAWQMAYNYIEASTYGIYVNADSMGQKTIAVYRDTIIYPWSVGGFTAGVHLEKTHRAVRIGRCRILPGSAGTAGIECQGRAWPQIDSTKLYSSPDMYNNHTAYGIYMDTPNSPAVDSVTNVMRDSIANFATDVYVGNCSTNPPRLGINGNNTYPGLNNIIGYRSELGNSWLVYYWGYITQQPLRAEATWWGSNPPYSDQFYGNVDYNPYRTTPASQPWICSEPGGGSAPQEAELLEALLPTHFDLGQSYPNPANGEMTIKYALPHEARVSLKVYNIAGQLVRNLVAESKKAGYHSVRWDGKTESGHSAGPGVYFYRMDAGTFTSIKKLVLAR